MFVALGPPVPLLATHLTLLSVGCAGTDAALSQPPAEARPSNVEDDATATLLGPESTSSANVNNAGWLDGGTHDASASTQTLDGLDAGDSDVRTDSGTHNPTSSFDASPPDSGTFDSELCARACHQSADLPCRDATCHERCVEELTASCDRLLRALYTCLASGDPSEFTCDEDGFLVGPSRCSRERTAYIDCKL